MDLKTLERSNGSLGPKTYLLRLRAQKASIEAYNSKPKPHSVHVRVLAAASFDNLTRRAVGPTNMCVYTYIYIHILIFIYILSFNLKGSKPHSFRLGLQGLRVSLRSWLSCPLRAPPFARPPAPMHSGGPRPLPCEHRRSRQGLRRV